ncbi:MAG: hypothetical protein ACI8QC_003423 [Planctomycetota bacterium]|jgi:hypothetical protein
MTSITTRRVAGLALLLLLGAFAVSSMQEDLRPRVEELLSELHVELTARPEPREPVGGPGETGRAWESYWKAADMLKTRPTSLFNGISDDAMAACLAGAVERSKESRRLALSVQVELALIREGARRRDISPFQSSEHVDLTQTLSVFHTGAMSNLLGLLGVADLDAGKQAEGVATLLDAMQISQDHSHSPSIINQMVGAADVIPDSLLAVLEHEGFGLFMPEALNALDAGLERLIARAPRRPNFVARLELVAITALEGPQPGPSMSQNFVSRILRPRPAPEKLFIEAYELAQEFDQVSPYEAIGLYWATRKPSPRDRRLTDTWLSMFQSMRRAVVRLQMLHHAIRLAQGREPAPFADPFEMPLKVTEQADGWLLEVGAVGDANAISLSFHR